MQPICRPDPFNHPAEGTRPWQGMSAAAGTKCDGPWRHASRPSRSRVDGSFSVPSPGFRARRLRRGGL